jgi:hypothetical protein
MSWTEKAWIENVTAATELVMNNIETGIKEAKEIASEAVTTVKIANEAVTAAKIGPEAVVATKLGNSSVEASKIKEGAVTTAKLGGEAVTESSIKAKSVTIAKLSTALTETAAVEIAAKPEAEKAMTSAKEEEASSTKPVIVYAWWQSTEGKKATMKIENDKVIICNWEQSTLATEKNSGCLSFIVAKGTKFTFTFTEMSLTKFNFQVL